MRGESSRVLSLYPLTTTVRSITVTVVIVLIVAVVAVVRLLAGAVVGVTAVVAFSCHMRLCGSPKFGPLSYEHHTHKQTQYVVFRFFR